MLFFPLGYSIAPSRKKIKNKKKRPLGKRGPTGGGGCDGEGHTNRYGSVNTDTALLYQQSPRPGAGRPRSPRPSSPARRGAAALPGARGKGLSPEQPPVTAWPFCQLHFHPFPTHRVPPPSPRPPTHLWVTPAPPPLSPTRRRVVPVTPPIRNNAPGWRCSPPPAPGRRERLG